MVAQAEEGALQDTASGGGVGIWRGTKYRGDEASSRLGAWPGMELEQQARGR